MFGPPKSRCLCCGSTLAIPASNVRYREQSDPLISDGFSLIVGPMSPALPDSGTARPSWTDGLRGRYGMYTLLINIGSLFFAVDNFLINTLMPSIVADIGGVPFYAWAMMLYLVGSIMGSASYGPLRG